MENEFVVSIDENVYDKLESREISNIILVNFGKAKKFKVGNFITISSEADSSKNFDAEILNMLYFDNIPDVLNMINKKEFGFVDSDTTTSIEDRFLEQFKLNDVDKYGVVVIQIQKK